MAFFSQIKVPKSFFVATTLSATLSVVRILLLFVLNKIVATFLGTAGFVVMGHLQNILSIAQSFGGRSLQPGIIRFLAPPQKTQSKSTHYFSAALIISFVGALVSAVVIALNYTDLFSIEGVGGIAHTLLWLLPLTIFSASLVTLSIALLQTRELYTHWFVLNIILLIIQVTVTISFILLGQLQGLFAALLITPIIQGVGVILLIILNREKHPITIFPTTLPLREIRTMSEYLLMGVVSVGLTPMVLLILRQNIVETLGVDMAGLWQSVMKLSELSLMLITSTFATWYLPQLAKRKGLHSLVPLVIKTGIIVGSITLVGSIIGWLLRVPLIEILFSSDFAGAQALFGWQLAILLLHVFSWLLGSVLVIHGRVKEFTILEVLGQLLVLFLALYYMPLYGIKGLFYAFIAEGILYVSYLTLRLSFQARTLDKNTQDCHDDSSN